MTAPVVATPDAAQRFTLAGHDVEVWWAELDVTPERFEMLRATLPAPERREGERQRCDPKRLIVARGLVREILGSRLGVDPAHLEIGRTTAGKPYLVDAPTALAFNVSHAAEWLVVAVAPGGAVGVDVERLRADVDTTRVARHMFTVHEIAALEALPAGERRRAFFSCWARKEACLKAIGTGLSIAPERIDVGLGPGRATLHFETDDWCVGGIATPRPDLVAAIAARV